MFVERCFSKIFFYISVWMVLALVFAFPVKAGTEDPFPVYPGIMPNVQFWTKIYTQHHTRQGVIHDSENLEIIYDVIDLKPSSSRHARRQNSRLIRKTIHYYSQILQKLAKGQVPYSEDEVRIAKIFGPSPDPLVLIEASRNIRFQRGQSDRFRDGIIRSGRYLEKIKSIMREYQLPEDLAYLPHVESSFNYHAYSKFGAAGMWQFTYGTGKRFMTIDYTVDERRDPIISAYAAAKLLKENYRKLGNWPLAVTAYNHGVNGMLRAQREKGDYKTIFNEYDGRRFKFASRNFYSEFLAARDIAKNSEAYFGKLALEEPFPVERIKLPGFVSVKKIASYFGTDINSIRYLNPALRRPVFEEQKYIPKGYELKLPLKNDTRQLAQAIPSDLFEPKQKRSRFYHVRKGDVAGAIARRHNISLIDLIRANNLDRRATIYVGQNLRIPGPGDELEAQTPLSEQIAMALEESETKVSSGKRREIVKAKLLKNGPSDIEEKINLSVVSGDLTIHRTFKSKNRPYGMIRVETGETLGHYAEWLEVSTQSIRRINGFPYGRTIGFNDKVIIPLNKVGKEDFEEKRYEYHKEFEEDFLSAYSVESVGTYVIQRGDNIWNLCLNEFELPFWLIRKYNPRLDVNRLKPGQTINVPIVEQTEP